MEVDSDRFELRLTQDKIVHIRDLVALWRRRRSGRFCDFESFVGHLAHAATVVRLGRTFLRELYSVMKQTNSRSHFVHLTEAARADLLWWDRFLHRWNGTMFVQESGVQLAHVYTDASGSIGCGGFVGSTYWFQLQWPASWSEVDISIKELVPIVIAAALWGPLWHRQCICFHSDNLGVVGLLARRSARDVLAHHLLRCLYFYSAYYQFDYQAEHVPGTMNTAADALSRGNLSLFYSLVPQAVHSVVPPAIQDLLIVRRPDWGSADWTTLFVGTLNTR